MRTRTLITVMTTLAVALAAAACEPARSSTSLAPARGALFGAYEQPGPRNATQQKAQITDAERVIGRKYDIVHSYENWTDGFPGWRENWIAQGGRTPLISWAGPVVTSITNGSQDHQIDARAKGLKSFGRPVLLRWFWEMDGSRNKARAIGPATYKAAWRRIVTRFRKVGAKNVKFVWCPTAYGFVNGQAQAWYPGDDVVDWTCADGYNWAPRRAGAEWTGFDKIFASFYAWGSKRPKPMIVGEFGVMEDPKVPGRKAQWLDNARYVLKTRYPRIRAVVYFSGDGDTAAPYPWYWQSTNSSKQAWRRWGQDTYFRTRG